MRAYSRRSRLDEADDPPGPAEIAARVKILFAIMLALGRAAEFWFGRVTWSGVFFMSLALEEEPDEPENRTAPEKLLMGPDHLGHWVVRDPFGRCGGIFINHEEAARCARAESLAHLPKRTVIVAVESLEFDPMFT